MHVGFKQNQKYSFKNFCPSVHKSSIYRQKIHKYKESKLTSNLYVSKKQKNSFFYFFTKENFVQRSWDDKRVAMVYYRWET